MRAPTKKERAPKWRVVSRRLQKDILLLSERELPSQYSFAQAAYTVTETDGEHYLERLVFGGLLYDSSPEARLAMTIAAEATHVLRRLCVTADIKAGIKEIRP